MNIQLVPLVDTDRVFPLCVEHIQRSITKGMADDLTVPYLFSECRASRAFLYVNVTDHITDAMILRFENPGIARVLIFGGEGGVNWVDELPKLAETIKPYASKLVFEGRKAWARKLPKAKIMAVRYEMELN